MPRPKGYKLSEETKEKIRKALKGRCLLSPEAIERMRKTKTGQKRSEAVKKSISDKLKGRSKPPMTESHRESLRKSILSVYERNPELKNILSERTKSMWKDSEYREKNISASLITRSDPVFKNKLRIILAARDPAYKKKISSTVTPQIIKRWKDPEYRDRNVRATMLGNRLKPNRQERTLDSLLSTNFPGDWKFVGDGQLIISGKCPDFVNVNGKKAIIELFGDYWHRGEDPDDRAKVFEPYGYSTLVIWGKELKNPDAVIENARNTFYSEGGSLV